MSTAANTTNLVDSLHTARRHGLTSVSQLLAVGYLLASHPERVRLSDLARHIAVSGAAVTQIADHLVSLSLAYREHATAERRVIHLTLTRKGREAALEILNA